MRVVKHEFYDCRAGTKLTLLPIADIQLTSRGCREDYLKKDIEKIKSNNNYYWLSGGDLGDYINVNDKRFDYTQLSGWAQSHVGNLANAQTHRLADYLSPIANKCLGMVKGNHEDSIHRYTGNDVYSELVWRLKEAGNFNGNDNLTIGYNGLILLDFYSSKAGERKSGKRRITIYVHHGSGGGSTPSGKINMIQKMVNNSIADLVIVGHLHTQIDFPDARYTVDRNGNLVIRPTWGVMTPSYLESYTLNGDSYGEKKGYKPIPLGWTEIDLWPMKKRLEEKIEIRKGLR